MMSEVSKEQLLDDVRDVLNNTVELIAQTSENGSDKARALRDKLTANLEVAKDRLLRAEEAVTAKAKVACKTTDQYAHDHPWRLVGLAAVVGFLLGLLVSRR